MEWLGELARRIHMLLHRDRTASELQEEMQLHLDLRQQQEEEAGLPADDAGYAARRRFGNATRVREQSYAAWGWQWLEAFLQDVVYGMRSLLRSPGITIVALLSLALGIGANTAIFSLMDAVMLRSLPVKDPRQLVLLGTASDNGFENGFDVTDLFSYPFYRQLQQRNRVFSQVGAIISGYPTVHGFVGTRSQAEPIDVQLVSGTYFSTLGVSAAMGRTLDDTDDRTEGGSPVAVISDSWWKRRLGADPAVLGSKIRFDTTTFTIVGVTPPEFFGTEVGEAPDLWMPLSMMRQVPPHHTSYTDDLDQCLFLFGRLRSGVTLAQTTTEVNFIRQQVLPNFPDAVMTPSRWGDLKRTHVPITPMGRGFSALRRQFSESLKILMAIVGIVLLVACANIANLLLARSTIRARELAVRQALGASRARLIRQLLTESLLLAIAGGALGVLVAQAATHLLLRLVSVPLDVSPNTHVLLFTLGLTVATTLLFGILPASRATRFELTKSLKDGRGTVGATRNLLAKTLIISQVSFSLVLVVTAALFLRSFVNLANADTGFNKQNVLRLNIDPSSVGYTENDPHLAALYGQIEERVAALPGVRADSFSSFVFHEGAWFGGVSVAGAPASPDVEFIHNVVGNGYFATMQMRLLAGRNFGPQDTATSQKVAIISQRMARALFPKGSPIGHRFSIGDPKLGDDVEVVGIVQDVKFSNLGERTQALGYLPYLQHPRYLRDFEVRYTGDFGAISTEVQQVIHQVDHNLPISHVTTLNEQVARFLYRPACRRTALHLLRSTRCLPLLDRDLRTHVLRRQSPHQRDRHPHGAGRGPHARAVAGGTRSPDTRRDRHCHRRSRSAGREPLGHAHALRLARRRSAEPARRRWRDAVHRDARRISPGPSRLTRRSHGRAALRVAPSGRNRVPHLERREGWDTTTLTHPPFVSTSCNGCATSHRDVGRRIEQFRYRSRLTAICSKSDPVTSRLA